MVIYQESKHSLTNNTFKCSLVKSASAIRQQLIIHRTTENSVTFWQGFSLHTFVSSCIGIAVKSCKESWTILKSLASAKRAILQTQITEHFPPESTDPDSYLTILLSFFLYLDNHIYEQPYKNQTNMYPKYKKYND
ncbi:hypothetical protein KIL84_017579 [Mauremys mutica]|uniref:Uncharacterized protein n=1 Tax=Mauremys mutica TaxID=74926 RepID=A0A9D3X6S0_9SAUR|nr:hypothetical protein KIL84_017579 [Mauremys mutica]